MVQLSRKSARPLLKTVAGKPHASKDDHIEEAVATTQPRRGITMEEADAIFADPATSDDDSSSSESPHNSPRSVPPAPQLGKPAMRGPAIRVPKKGDYAGGKAARARQATEDKENRPPILKPSSPPQPSLKRAAGISKAEESHVFGWEHDRPSKRQRLANIHAPSGRTTYGAKRTTFGGRQRQPAPLRERRTGLLPNDEDLEDVSLEDLCKPAMETAKKNKGPPRTHGMKNSPLRPPSRKDETSNPFKTLAGFRDDKSRRKEETSDLFKTLAAYRQDTISNPQSTTPSFDDADASGTCTLQSRFSTRAQTLQELEQVAESIPAAPDDGKCPLCDSPVDVEQHRAFFASKTKARTIRDMQRFCHDHKKRTALQQYREKGYSTIDWDGLPNRISQHHDYISSIIKNEKPSKYRDTYMSLATERKTGATLMEENADLATQTGYYGGRGRRAMMEAIMTTHGHVIYDYSLQDTAISAFGIANFVLRVLVPELTIVLVMEDFECGEERAVEIVGESGEIGNLANEEIEDRVEGGESGDEGVDDSRGEIGSEGE
ncbi:hypothetical protein M011DRAFT_483731 [Sporormia fimetaria CBS 119925]|uniref:Restriction of telomere capping protein 4 n=1 Tax=Sporormia fimetaria CBS 119925 TaxID=1340428 RepID=A0A6A6VNL5_9PLEO|nr:hypothetical protein M011DRAFT_483731 [Sporormia fimetaria CBS 119925]